MVLRWGADRLFGCWQGVGESNNRMMGGTRLGRVKFFPGMVERPCPMFRRIEESGKERGRGQIRKAAGGKRSGRLKIE